MLNETDSIRGEDRKFQIGRKTNWSWTHLNNEIYFECFGTVYLFHSGSSTGVITIVQVAPVKFVLSFLHLPAVLHHTAVTVQYPVAVRSCKNCGEGIHNKPESIFINIVAYCWSSSVKIIVSNEIFQQYEAAFDIQSIHKYS